MKNPQMYTVLGLNVLLPSTACDPDRICSAHELRPGDQYEVTVLGIDRDYDLISHTPCPIDDIKEGQKFRVTARGQVRTAGSCLAYECPADLPSASEAASEPTYSEIGFADLCRNHSRKVRVGASCELGRYVAIAYSGGSIYTAPRNGQTGVTLHRALTRKGGTHCDELPPAFAAAEGEPLPCDDWWHVQIKAIEK